MASFPELRPYDLPSVTPDGCRLFRIGKPAAAAALLLAAASTAPALLELATLQGYRAVLLTLGLLAGVMAASPAATALARTPAAARGTA